MTNQEAIKRLREINYLLPSLYTVDLAIDLAIEALKQQENMVYCKDCKWCVGWSKGLLCDIDKTTIVETFATNYCSWGEARGGK